LSRQSNRDIPRTNFLKGFSSGSNLMRHEVAGCLLVKLFALHTTYFRISFSVGSEQNVLAPEEQRLQNEAHISDWILVVSSLLTWHPWMKQPTIAKKQIKGSHVAVQWLMRLMATVTPRTTGMTHNTIKNTWSCIFAETFSTMVYLTMKTARILSLLTFLSQR
jgi:hypothetical protein